MSMVYDSEYPVPMPPILWDNMGFWEGIKRHELVFQRCKECGTWLHPPRPVCPKCRSLEKEWAHSTGKGTVYSWVTYLESAHPSFKAPYSVVLVEMEEGVRLVSNMVDIRPQEISIGMPVEVVFDDIAEGLTLPKFRKAG
ncbi:MAG: Zn-ribbon domain-containing OB-fold protein [Dehalococcoidia bacterium]